MSDETERPPSFEATPTRVGSPGVRWAVIVAALAVGLVAVALVKPWGDARPRAPDASPSPDAPVASPPGPISDQALDVAPAAPTPYVDGRAPRPVRLSGDPVGAAAPLVGEIAQHAGAWGIGAGGFVVHDPGVLTWTSWQAVKPVRSDDPGVRGFIDRERVCGVGAHLQGGAAVLAVTSPRGIRPDWIVEGWVLSADGSTVITPRVQRVALPSTDGAGTSALVFADGSVWDDGIYRLLVEGGSGRLMIDVCLGSGSRGTGPSPTDSPTNGVFRTIVADLAPRSGEWGVGTGGPDGGGAEGAWVEWRVVTPAVEDRSIEIKPPPSCTGREGVRAGLLVGLTVPAALPPDWRVETIRFDGRGRSVLDSSIRQVSPPGNRGITYLIRSDGSAWPGGAYRFRIMTSTHSIGVDACLVAR